jgi:hypothetical protein
MPSGDSLQAELYLRADSGRAVSDQQRRVRERLNRAFGDGKLRIREHPERVPASGERAVLDRYEDARSWASENEVSLSPFFESHRTYHPDSGAVREMVTLPVLWLALTDGSSVTAVYPHVDSEVETVSSALTALCERAGPDAAGEATN